MKSILNPSLKILVQKSGINRLLKYRELRKALIIMISFALIPKEPQTLGYYCALFVVFATLVIIVDLDMEKADENVRN